MAKEKSEKTNLYLLSIVAIVAVVGIVVLLLNGNKWQSSEFTQSDITGAAVTKHTCRMYCTDSRSCYSDAYHEDDRTCGSLVWSDTRRSSYCDENGDIGTARLDTKMLNLCGSYDYGYLYWGEDFVFGMYVPASSYLDYDY